MAIDRLTGLTTIDCSAAAVTVRVSMGEVTPLRLAVTLLVPAPTPVARPVLLMVAVVVVAEFQVTAAVIFCVLVSL